VRRESIRVFAKVAGTATPGASSRCLASVCVAPARRWTSTSLRAHSYKGGCNRWSRASRYCPGRRRIHESNDKPLSKVHGNTDRTDCKSRIENERAANRRVVARSVCGRYIRRRSVTFICGRYFSDYYPHESPANIHLTGRAVDAGDTFAGSPSHQRCGRGNAQTFSYGGVIQDEALSNCGLSLVQAAFIYVLLPGLAG
jgi:hypothetical protein